MDWEQIGFNAGYNMAQHALEMDHQRRVDAAKKAMGTMDAPNAQDRAAAEQAMGNAIGGQAYSGKNVKDLLIDQKAAWAQRQNDIDYWLAHGGSETDDNVRKWRQEQDAAHAQADKLRELAAMNGLDLSQYGNGMSLQQLREMQQKAQQAQAAPSAAPAGMVGAMPMGNLTIGGMPLQQVAQSMPDHSLWADATARQLVGVQGQAAPEAAQVAAQAAQNPADAAGTPAQGTGMAPALGSTAPYAPYPLTLPSLTNAQIPQNMAAGLTANPTVALGDASGQSQGQGAPTIPGGTDGQAAASPQNAWDGTITQRDMYGYLKAKGVKGFEGDYDKQLDALARQAAAARMAAMDDDAIRAQLRAKGYANDIISAVLKERKAKLRENAAKEAIAAMAASAGNPMMANILRYYQAAGADPKYLSAWIEKTTPDYTLDQINTGGTIETMLHDKNGFGKAQSANFAVTLSPYQEGQLKNENQKTQAQYAANTADTKMRGEIAVLNHDDRMAELVEKVRQGDRKARIELEKMRADANRYKDEMDLKRYQATHPNAGGSARGGSGKGSDRWTTSTALSAIKEADAWDEEHPDDTSANPIRDAADDATAFLNKTGNYGNYDMDDKDSAYSAVQDILEENYRQGYRNTPYELYTMICSMGGYGPDIAQEYWDNGMLEQYGKTD